MYTVRQVETEADLNRWLLLRQSVYLAEELLTSCAVGETVYRDEFDEHSAHFLAFDPDNQPVASGRLILRGPERPLQVETEFGLSVGEHSAEISGFAVLPKHRKSLVSIGMIRALLEDARRRGLADIYAEVEPWFFEALIRFGYPIEQVSDPKFTYGAMNLVFRVGIDELFSSARDLGTAGDASVFAVYYSHPWDWSVSDRHLTPFAGTAGVEA